MDPHGEEGGGSTINGVIGLPNGGEGRVMYSESDVAFPSATFLLIDEDVTTRNDGEFNPGTSLDSIDDFGMQHTSGSNITNADTSTKHYPFGALSNPSIYARFSVTRDLE